MRKSLILLGILDDSDIEWTIRAGAKLRVAPGEKIIREGEPLGSIYIVLDGAFNVSVGDAKNVIAKLYAGDILGEMSFVDSRPPSATVTAAKESWVLEIPRAEVRLRMEEDAGFSGRFYRALAVFLTTRLRETVSHLGYGKAVADDNDDMDESGQLPDDLLDHMALAGKRFNMLQGRTRSVASAS